MKRKPFKDITLTLFLAVIRKDQRKLIDKLAKVHGVSKSKALRWIIDQGVKNFSLK